MRRFFRFTVRDLLWLTLVVAVALAWFVRERQLRAEVEKAWWRSAAGALEATARDFGLDVVDIVNRDSNLVEPRVA